MPRRIDTAGRDRLVVEAAWTVLTRDGLTALSVRNVAAEAGLPPSSLRYTFPSQAILRERAVLGVLDRMRARVAALPEEAGSRSWARAALLELLPLDEPRRNEMEVALTLGNAAMTDTELVAANRAFNDTVAEVCRDVASALGRESLQDRNHLHALIDGLALHIVRRTHGDDPKWAVDVVDAHLAGPDGGPAR